MKCRHLYTLVQADYGIGLETQPIENTRYAERSGAVVAGTTYPRLERALILLETAQAHPLIVHEADFIALTAPPFTSSRKAVML